MTKLLPLAAVAVLALGAGFLLGRLVEIRAQHEAQGRAWNAETDAQGERLRALGYGLSIDVRPKSE